MVDDDTDLDEDLGAEWTSTIFLPRPVNLLSIKACPISEVKSQINSDNMIVKVWLTHRKCKQWYFQDSLIISESLCLSNYWFVLLDFAFTPIDRSVIVLDWQSSKLYVRGVKWFILWSHQLFQTLFHCLVQNQPSPVIPWIPADVSGHQVGTIIGLTAACSVDNGIENGDDNTLNLMFPICNLFSSNLVIVQAKDGWEEELMDESGLGSLPVCVVSLFFLVHLFPFFYWRRLFVSTASFLFYFLYISLCYYFAVNDVLLVITIAPQ